MAKDWAMEACNSGKPRKCTDCFCVLLFAALWGVMLYIVYTGFTTGDPNRLIYGIDYKFDQCGQNNTAEARGLDGLNQTIESDDGDSRDILLGGKDLTEAPYYYVVGPGPPQWLQEYVGICDSQCPNEGGTKILLDPKDWVCTGRYYGQGNRPPIGKDLPRLTKLSRSAVDKFVKDVDALATGGREDIRYLKSFFLLKRGDCLDTADNEADACSVCYPAYPSTVYAGAFCLPDVTFVKESGEEIAQAFRGLYNITFVQEASRSVFGNADETTMRLFSDLFAARWVVLGCVAGAVAVGFLWAFIIQHFIRPAIIVTIVGVFLGAALATYVLYYRSEEMMASPNYGEDRVFTTLADLAFGFFIVMAAFLGVYALLVCIFMRKIWMAVGVIKEAARAMQALPTVLFVPVLPAFVSVGMFAFLIIGAFYILSAAELKLDANGFANLEYDNTLKGMLAIHFFGFLWTLNLINHAAHFIVAGAVTQWFFAPDKSKVGLTPVLGSMGRLARYHLGSVVFGSLLVAIVQFVRAYFKLLKRSLTPPDGTGKCGKCGQRLVACAFSCLDCCLKCWEKFLEFISINAYVLINIETEPFCASARAAFGYLMSDLIGLALVQAIGDSFLFLGCLFIALVCAALCGAFLLFTPWYALEPTSIVMPCLIVFIGAFIIAKLFMGIFEMAIDTIFMCFLLDQDKGLGYTSDELKAYVDDASVKVQKKKKPQSDDGLKA